ncbi:MAG: PTS lactose/cellobiose transporter subunit IIA [Metamycoplasmataceae bacterium]
MKTKADSNSLSKHILEIISNAELAKKHCFNVFSLCKEKEFKKAEQELKFANKKVILAERIYFRLIQKELNEKNVEHSLLLIHAESQFSNARMFIDISHEIMSLYKR